MILEVLNKRTPRYRTLKSEGLVFDVDRSTPLGNPFFMDAESQRDLVCTQYIDWFCRSYMEQQHVGLDGDLTKFPFWRRLCDLYFTALHSDIYLGCWCAPKRCHGETIMSVINTIINEPDAGICNYNIQYWLEGRSK